MLPLVLVGPPWAEACLRPWQPWSLRAASCHPKGRSGQRQLDLPNPFEEVWPEVEELFEQDAGRQAKTEFDELVRRYPGRFQAGQLRTLQRRFRDWRALRGGDREVYFAQRHHRGEQSQSDFTDMRSLGVTIAGVAFEHLVYHFVLTYSNWESVSCSAKALPGVVHEHLLARTEFLAHHHVELADHARYCTHSQLYCSPSSSDAGSG